MGRRRGFARTDPEEGVLLGGFRRTPSRTPSRRLPSWSPPRPLIHAGNHRDRAYPASPTTASISCIGRSRTRHPQILHRARPNPPSLASSMDAGGALITGHHGLSPPPSPAFSSAAGTVSPAAAVRSACGLPPLAHVHLVPPPASNSHRPAHHWGVPLAPLSSPLRAGEEFTPAPAP